MAEKTTSASDAQAGAKLAAETGRAATAANTRDRIVAAAARLFAEGGREAVSTRTVAAAAGVQAPTIYRLFGHKQGLLDAMADHSFLLYRQRKLHRPPDADPIDGLRTGWDLHVGFGLDNPALYVLIYGEPRPGVLPPAIAGAAEVLAARIRRVAAAGRLRVSEEHAAHLFQAAGCGTTLMLLALPEEQRDLAMSTMAREAAIAAITTEAPTIDAPGTVGAAVALRAALPQLSALTAGERGLLREWLDRIAAPAAPTD